MRNLNGRKKETLSIFLLGGLLLLTPASATAAGLEADLVIYNGKILTADSPDPNNFRIAQAAAIYAGKFIAVGSNDDALQYAGPNTQRIDVGGRTVIPGLVETHNHIFGGASHFFPQGKPRVGRTDAGISYTTKEEFLAQLRTVALKEKPGEWIITSPGRAVALQLAIRGGEISRFDMDKVAPENPVYLHWNSSVEAFVNTKTLDLLLTRYPKIPGVRKDAKGVPTGSLTGVANVTSWFEFWPQVPPDALAPYYKMEMEEMAAQGVTAVSTKLAPNDLAAYSWLHGRGELPIRMGYTFQGVSRNLNVDAMFSRLVGLQGGSGKNIWGAGDEMLWIVGMAPTFSIDSVPGVGGSCVSKEWPREAVNFPNWRYQLYGPNGLCRLADPDYNDADAIRAAAKYGFRVSAMHTGGDRGIDQFLDIAEEMTQLYPDIPERRWAIDHCRFLNDQQAVRAKKYNIMFSCGPKYIYAGAKGDVGAYTLLYGEEVGPDSVVPLRRLLNHGLKTTLELDQHGFYPFLALEVSVTREDIDGKVWGPQQRINRREAFYTYTRWSSEYLLKENLLGSIEPKKAADFVVLNRDYLTVPDNEIGQIDVLLTVVAGKIVYTQAAFATSMGLPQAGFRGNPTWWLRGIPEDKTRSGGSAED